jgi:hypothetical protein
LRQRHRRGAGCACRAINQQGEGGGGEKKRQTGRLAEGQTAKKAQPAKRSYQLKEERVKCWQLGCLAIVCRLKIPPHRFTR